MDRTGFIRQNRHKIEIPITERHLQNSNQIPNEQDIEDIHIHICNK